MANRGVLREHKLISIFAYLSADMIAIVSSALLAHLARFGTIGLAVHLRATLIIGVLLALLVFPQMRLYDSWRGRSLLVQVRSVLLAWVSVLLCLILLGYVLKVSATISREWFGFWAVLGGFELVLGRTLGAGLLRAMRNWGHNQRRLVIVGTGALEERAIRHVQTNESAGWHCCRAVAVGSGDDVPARVAGVPVSTRPDRLPGLVRRGGIDEVWICLPLNEFENIQKARHCLRHSTVMQRLVPDLSAIRLMRHQVDEILDMPMLNLVGSPMHGVNRVLKAVEDRVLGSFILLVASPFMLFIALAIKATSKGPVIYIQGRHGWDGQLIKVYKFRSMYALETPENNVVQACQNDARLTPFGRFLRHTSLDELPQFINVLKGEMSIVGPRPHAIDHNERYKERIDAYMQRHRVKPGITGWAQVQGWRGETDTLDKMRKRIEHDLYYIEHWSLWLDLKIIFLTAFRGMMHANAY